MTLIKVLDDPDATTSIWNFAEKSRLFVNFVLVSFSFDFLYEELWIVLMC